MDDLTLEELDRDGALRETAAAAHEARRSMDPTRAQFLKRAGALGAAGIVIGGISLGSARAQGGGLPKGDVDILNYALTLEFLEAAFYKEALSKGELSGESLAFAQVVAAHEQAHVEALQAALGSAATKAPTFDFKGTTNSEGTFQRTAQTLEDTGVSAYQGQAPEIKTPEVLASAGAILAVEARHAAWVRDIIGAGQSPTPAPAAFNKAMTMKEVLDAVGQTGFIQS